jgi:hypothetical protein
MEGFLSNGPLAYFEGSRFPEDMKKSSLLNHFLFLCLVLALPMASWAGPGGKGQPEYAVGFRAGWVGGPNGATVRMTLGPINAFEFVAGINNKAMRRSQFHNGIYQFDTYLGASYQPSFMIGEEDLSVGFYGNVGPRLRIHNYRFHYGEARPITPDLIAGLGMLLTTRSIQAFADIHVKYTDPSNYNYAWGLESGLGLRINLNR